MLCGYIYITIKWDVCKIDQLGNLSKKNLLKKEFWVRSILGPKKNWVPKNFGSKILESKRTLVAKIFGSSKISVKNVSGPNKFSPPKILGPNVPLAYGIPRNLPLKVGQNWRSNSWDIADMNKCSEIKCCLEKCHWDS